MLHHLRRIFASAAIFIVAALVYQVWRQNQPGYGLFDLIRGRPEGLAVVGSPKLSDSDVPSLARFSEESMKLAAAVLPSVVSIDTDTVSPTMKRVYGNIYQAGLKLTVGLGSGAIISKDGYVVTNNHVIEHAARIKIITNDGVRHDAEFIGSNEEADIAVLRIAGGGEFPALSFANSDEVRVGQVVFAVGNPFGLSGTVTQGIISATQRQLPGNGRPFLQTDTVINPGNSGGPLVNIRGEIVGINQSLYGAASTGPDKPQTWSGVGLTIPSNDAKAEAETIIKSVPKGGVARGYLGLEFNNAPVKVNLGQPFSLVGALVERVIPGSPADKAGFLPGDVIVRFGPSEFRSPEELRTLIAHSTPGLVASIEVWRNGQPTNLVITMGREP